MPASQGARQAFASLLFLSICLSAAVCVLRPFSSHCVGNCFLLKAQSHLLLPSFLLVQMLLIKLAPARLMKAINGAASFPTHHHWTRNLKSLKSCAVSWGSALYTGPVVP